MWAGYSWPDTVGYADAEGMNYHYMQPKEGRISWVCGFGLFADSENYRHAHEYVSSWASTKAAEFLLGYYYYGHTNTEADLSVVPEGIREALGLDDPTVLEEPKAHPEQWIRGATCTSSSGPRSGRPEGARAGAPAEAVTTMLDGSDEQLTEAQWRRRDRRATGGILGVPLLWLVLFFVVPVLFVAVESVGAVKLFPNDTGIVTFGNWRRFLLGDSVYMALFWKSIRMSLTVSIVVVVLAYPIGYFLALCVSKRKYVLVLLIIAPFLTSYLLRVLAWKVILGDAGVVNSFLFWTGLREPDDPVTWLIYSQFTVMLVLVYVWVPFVALPIFVSLENLDRSLLEAAGDLGAGRWQTFARVTLRLSAPGVFAAFLFVFIPTIGEFVTPLLVGGPSGYMYGNAIQDAFTRGLDWETGSMLAIFMLVVIAILMAVFGRHLRVRSVAG